jgi:hypothetical protein
MDDREQILGRLKKIEGLVQLTAFVVCQAAGLGVGIFIAKVTGWIA